MADFDFITDDGLRRSLESDLVELNQCYEARAWKAVHVLSGSIIEATLIDYLVSAGKLTGAAAITKDLTQLIEACKTNAVLSNKAVELSAIIRSYRNLIHPGRALRLSETVDENSASIAKAVIEIVVEEVSGKKKQIYGYTAEQVVRKVSDDPSSLSIAEYLLRETHEAELNRLLLSVIPDAYLGCAGSDLSENSALAWRLRRLFRLTLKFANPALKARVGQKYVAVLKEEPEAVVRSFERGLFRGEDLVFIDAKFHPLVITHFLETLRQSPDPDVFIAAEGITPHLDDSTLKEFIKILATSVLREPADPPSESPAAKLLFHESWELPENKREELLEALKALREDYKYNDRMLKVCEILELSVEVPF